MPKPQTDVLEKTFSGGEDALPAPPCVIVLFGATGDLAQRKIAPALYNLLNDGLLGDHVAVLGIARHSHTDEEFRNEMLAAVQQHSRSGPVDMDVWGKFARRWHYHASESGSPDEFRNLAEKLNEMDKRYDTGGSRLFYLALPPLKFPSVIANLVQAGLNRPAGDDGFVRLVVEKPFGHDLASAKALDDLLLADFQESQIYRIDHYLGKETAQNILVFRFANAIFDPLLNRRYVDRMEITTAETVGMEGRRGEYYETAGALRDMVQNHMLQLLALATMDAPSCIRCGEVRDEKVKVLQAIASLSPQEVARWTVRGQYGAADGSPAYRQEAKVAPNSMTETYAAVRLFVDNKRWSGVPFYLRTGKKLAAKASQIIVVFKREATRALEELSCDVRGANRLCIRINPDEGIWMTFDAKVPGVRMLVRPVRMDFRYHSSFESATPEAYEQLLLDAASGDPTLFIRNDEVEAAWRIVDSIRDAWNDRNQPPLETYEPGSWGPADADRIFGDPYKHWQSF